MFTIRQRRYVIDVTAWTIALTIVTVTVITNLGTTLSCACMGEVEQNPDNYVTDQQIAYQWQMPPRDRSIPRVKKVKTDLRERLFQRDQIAADRGDIQALFRLGQKYESGAGVPRDYSLAIESYKKAALNGLPEAQYNLGVMYAEGRGVTQDFAEAHRLFSQAAWELVDARFNLAVMHERGYGVPQDYAEAAKLYRIAAEDDDHGAQYALGDMYADGRGVPRDYSKAIEWFQLAAVSGNAEAQYRLGRINENGLLGVAPDVERAAGWYLAAAEAGYAPAQRSIGLMYQTGRGVSQDQRKADWWLTKWKWAPAVENRY